MYFIVGLGNPGEQYRNNRHNVGFLFLDYLSQKNSGEKFKKKNHYCFLKERLEGEETLLIKPQTFMNLSGTAITAAMAFFKLHRNRLIVVYDDIALPFGTIRIREKGSSGGHNGLKHIEKELGTQDYLRVRIGVDAPVVEGGLADFVLSNFQQEQLQRLTTEIFPNVEQAIRLIMKGEIAEAMNQYNAKNKT